MVRANRVIVCAAAVVGLGGCAAGRLSSEPPPGVTLEGAWKLNHGSSDDPQKIIDRMRAQLIRRTRNSRGSIDENRRGRASGRRATRGAQGDAGAEDRQMEDEEASAQHEAAGPGGDPLRHSPLMHALLANISRGDFLTVRQTPEQIVLDYGTSVRSFTPGGHSVVSAEGGVADQTSGWTGKEYVVQIKPQMGPRVLERYGLSEDRKHLVVKLHFEGGESPKVDLTRVYDFTDEVAPRVLPTND